MREKILQSIESRILTVFPSGSTYSQLAINESEIPIGIKHFLLSALQRRSEMEASELLSVRSEWFDADNLEYQKVLQQAVMTLGNASRFPASEWPKAVHQAVESVVDYLVSPVDLLSRFVFPGDTDSVSATDIQRKTGYFTDYAYLGHGVDAFIERKNSQRIFKTDFFNALSHLDHQYNAQNTAEKWIKLLRPLTEIVGLPSPGIPVPMAIRFFSEKGKPELGLEIDKAARARQAEIVSPASLYSLLEAALDPKPDLVAPKAAPQSAVQTPEKPPGNGSPQAEAEPAVVNIPPKEDSHLPLWKKFQKTETTPKLSSEESTPEPLWKTFSRQKEQAGVLNTLNVESALPPTTPAPDPAIVVLGSSAKKSATYIQLLFKGNQQAFDDCMTALARAPDWTTASEIIAQRVFRPFNVDIYSADAVDFTNAVESRYAGLQS